MLQYLQNNDEEELRERQRQRATELQQQQLSSPTTDVIDRRKSVGPATGMTNAAIVEHYSNCIKLSAENVLTIDIIKHGTINLLSSYLLENQYEECI